jgi:hypothetical protein
MASRGGNEHCESFDSKVAEAFSFGRTGGFHPNYRIKSSEVDSILLVLFPIIKVVILSLVNRKGGHTTTILS